jgi:hypothetical protein
MEAVITGRLIKPCSLLEENLKKIKNIEICVLSADDDYEKIQNIWNQYKSGVLPIRNIDRASGLVGYRLVIKVNSIVGKISTSMLKTPKNEWEGMQVKVRFLIQPYNFRSKKEENRGENVFGYNFVLKYIEN